MNGWLALSPPTQNAKNLPADPKISGEVQFAQGEGGSYLVRMRMVSVLSWVRPPAVVTRFTTA